MIVRVVLSAGLIGACLAAAAGAAVALVALPGVNMGPSNSDAGTGTVDIAPSVTPPAPPAGTAEERPPTGNPLWAIPLRELSATRERPIFSPSRRPPPPAVAAAPRVATPRVAVKPAEPERPQLSLVGTIAGAGEGFGIFVDQTTKNVVRLRTVDGHRGWILRSVRGREATLEKDRETVVLALPAPGQEQPAVAARPPADPDLLPVKR